MTSIPNPVSKEPTSLSPILENLKRTKEILAQIEREQADIKSRISALEERTDLLGAVSASFHLDAAKRSREAHLSNGIPPPGVERSKL